MENLLNIKSNWKHATLEYLIKKYDASQNMSRSAVFEREVRAAQGVKDWKAIQASLADLEREEDAPVFKNLQARYGEETAALLPVIRADILDQLQGTLKVLQAQYMVVLLQANYLEQLKRERLALKADGTVEEASVDLPELAKLLCEMMLQDKDCPELAQIRALAVAWRNRG